MRRRCRRCKRVKSISKFYRHSCGWDRICRDCKCKARRLRYRKNRDQTRAYERKRSRNPKRKAYVARKQSEWRARNPKRYKARTAVANALRDGRLKKEPCELCGTRKRVQAHHDDYSKPLAVCWLCFKCHRESKHDQQVG